MVWDNLDKDFANRPFPCPLRQEKFHTGRIVSASIALAYFPFFLILLILIFLFHYLFGFLTVSNKDNDFKRFFKNMFKYDFLSFDYV